MINVGIIEDDKEIRSSLCNLLNSDIEFECGKNEMVRFYWDYI